MVRDLAICLTLSSCLLGCERGDPEPAPDVEVVSPLFNESPPIVLSDASPPALVVLVMIDTLRADHVGACGSTLGLTPRIDALAASGAVFRSAIAPSSWTRASIASLFTGRYPTAVACVGRDDRLAAEFLTVAEALRTFRGYDTIGVYANGNVSYELGFAQGFDVYRYPDSSTKTGYPGDALVYPGAAVTDAVLAEVDQWMTAHGDSRPPLFLYAHYVDPHDPYLPHPDLIASIASGRFDGSRADLDRLRNTPRGEVTEEDRERIRGLYRGEVRYCDAQVGRLLDGLTERLGSLDESLVVLTADHGEGLWNHGRRTHGVDLFEEQIRVPLIVKVPGAAAGVVVDDRVSLVDVAPTLLARCGVPVPSYLQGRDLASWLDGRSESGIDTPRYSELDIDGVQFRTVSDGRRKLVHNRRLEPGHPYEYVRFNLDDDPKERTNLFGTPDGAVEDRELLGWLERYVAAIDGSRRGEPRLAIDDLDPETQQNLRALGYTGGK